MLTFVYKGTTYTYELLSDDLKEVMKVEIAKAKERKAYLESLKNLAIDEPKEPKKYKKLDD